MTREELIETLHAENETLRKERDEARAAEAAWCGQSELASKAATKAEAERDAAIARAEQAEAEVVRLRSVLSKDENTVMIAYEDGDHQRLARTVGKLTHEHDALRAQLDEALKAAPYCELIDATPENQRETMLYDALVERDALRAMLREAGGGAGAVCKRGWLLCHTG